jgi:hypothetical protein
MVKGWLYIIINRAIPGLVKIGYSLKDPKLRAQELNHTGAPHPYEAIYEVLVYEPRAQEHDIHKHLNNKREGKEWFRLTPCEAVRNIRDVLGGDPEEYEEPEEPEEPEEEIIEEAILCEYAGCNSESKRGLNGHRYCIRHAREIRDPNRMEKTRLLREELERIIKKRE